MAEKRRRKTLGFALGAGGARGVAHVGFLQAMEEAGIKPDYITGCSMGSVVGGAYAAGVTIEQMKQAIFKLRLLDLISPTGQKGGFSDTRKIRKVLERYMGDPDFADLKIPFRCIAVDMVTQTTFEFREGNVIEGIAASSTIPMIFKPLEKDGMRLIDGGILDRVPYREVKGMGADVVVAVDVLGKLDCSEKMPSTIGVLMETIDLLCNIRSQMKHNQDKDIIDFWLEPPLGNMSQFTFKQFEFAYQQGYEIGKEYAPKIKKALKNTRKKG